MQDELSFFDEKKLSFILQTNLKRFKYNFKTNKKALFEKLQKSTILTEFKIYQNIC